MEDKPNYPDYWNKEGKEVEPYDPDKNLYKFVIVAVILYLAGMIYIVAKTIAL
jgi:hypothetical protein